MSNTNSPLFTIINSINWDKDADLIHEYNESDYVPFLVNRGMSMNPDTVLYAQDMNLSPNLDRILQYKYYLYSVRKKKRYSSWAKKIKVDDNMKIISEYYGISIKKAKECSDMISSEDLDHMKSYLEKGGVKKK